MDIYNLEYKTLNDAIENKNKKVINQFLKLPIIIKKRFIYQSLDINSLIEQINIPDCCDIISLFQDDIIMFEKIYIRILLSIKKTFIQKYKFNRIKDNIINIGNHLISHLMILIEKNKINNFENILSKQTDIFNSWNLNIKDKKTLRKQKYNFMKKILELYDKEFQKLSIYIAGINKYKFLNIIIESGMQNYIKVIQK